MELHVPTAALSVLVSEAVLVAALALYASLYRTCDGFRQWAAGAWLLGLGFLALAARPWAPVPSIVATNLLLAAGLLANLDGALRFVRNAPLDPRWYGVALALGALQGSLASEEEVILRQWIFALVGGATLLGTGRVLLAGAPAKAPLLYRSFGAFQFVYLAVLVLRTMVRTQESQGMDILRAGTAEALYFLFLAAANLVFLAGYMLLNTQRLESELAASRDEIRILTGILPICAWCKKIRDGEGDWQPVESYVRKHSEAVFSHGICPDCTGAIEPEAGRPPLD